MLKSYVEDVEFMLRMQDEIILAQVCEEVIKSGRLVLNIPDTTGCCFTRGTKILKTLKSEEYGVS
jgi:isopropylmalate/homocitrate/citramalate synthase